MDKHFISIALIQQFEGHRLQWLANWKKELRALDFVTGCRLEQESFRETIMREVAWTLSLSRERDFLVSNAAQINWEFVGRLAGDRRDRHIAVAFYPVHLFGQRARQQIEVDENFRWVTADEIYADQTCDGQVFNPVLIDMIRRTRVIQPWESQ